jgi:hypothetical protein
VYTRIGLTDLVSAFNSRFKPQPAPYAFFPTPPASIGHQAQWDEKGTGLGTDWLRE